MSALFACVQLEFARPLGPSEGRYVVRRETPDGPGADVLDVRAIAARVVTEPPRRLHRRRSAAEATVLSLVRYTLIRASRPMPGERPAREWLASLRADDRARAHEAELAVTVLNTAIRAYRVAAGDPYAVEISQAEAHAVRFGVGTPRQLFDGDGLAWLTDGTGSTAVRSDVAHAPTDRLGPTRAVADALAGRLAPQPADDLVLRALLDLRHGNPRGGAATLLAALEAIAAEPPHPGVVPPPAEDGLLERARTAAREVLTGAVAAGEERATLRALAIELRERLQAAAQQRLEACEPTSGKGITDDESMSKLQRTSDGSRTFGELLAS
jgi:hypothetical protein